MSKKILFSPVGGTDPMSERNYYDGPLLHIARYYQPDIIYLYMSKEILQNHEKDDRYRYCIKKLGKRLNHVFEVVVIERKEFENVHLFDPIYPEFETILDDIIDKMDGTDKLLLNISSGTPAMKSALLVLATMIDIDCQCIQVDTPTRKMNQHEHSEVYGLEERWKLNQDNNCESDNRTHLEELVSLKRLKYEEVIKKYISAYNYHAALVLAEEMKVEHTTPYINKLRLADARQQLDFETVDTLVKSQDSKVYRPVSDSKKKRQAYEYMLALQAKVARAEYADFVRGVSPILTDLFQEILLEQKKFDIMKFTSLQKNVLKWDKNKLYRLKEFIPGEAYDNKSFGGYIKTVDLIRLMEMLNVDRTIMGYVNKLRKVEESVRNMAAHNMISVTDQWIKETTGCTSNKIIDLIKAVFSYTSYNIESDCWNSYKYMNSDIIKAITPDNLTLHK